MKESGGLLMAGMMAASVGRRRRIRRGLAGGPGPCQGAVFGKGGRWSAGREAGGVEEGGEREGEGGGAAEKEGRAAEEDSGSRG